MVVVHIVGVDGVAVYFFLDALPHVCVAFVSRLFFFLFFSPFDLSYLRVFTLSTILGQCPLRAVALPTLIGSLVILSPLPACCMEWCGVVWCGVWYGMVWYGMVWCGMI